MRELRTAVVVAALLALYPAVAQACSVCFGDEDGALSAGLNAGIAILLGLVLAVQVLVVRFFWNASRRARAQREEAESAGAPSEALR